jgi:hypothetical protein
MIRSRKELNVFNDYLGFLKQTGQLTPEEEALIGSVGHDFLKRMEVTSMSKTYKMPVLLAFWNDGRMKTRVTEEDLVRSFRSFYQKSSNRIDLLRDQSTQGFESWGNKEIISLMKRNPLRFLEKTEHEFFHQEKDLFCLSQELDSYVANPTFVNHFKDIIDYRTTRFYRERLEKLNE